MTKVPLPLIKATWSSVPAPLAVTRSHGGRGAPPRQAAGGVQGVHAVGPPVGATVGVMLGEPATPPQTFSGSTYSMPSLPLGDRLSCSVKFVVPSLHLKGPMR